MPLYPAQAYGVPESAADVSLERFGTLQTRFQDAGGYKIDAELSRELNTLAGGSAQVSPRRAEHRNIRARPPPPRIPRRASRGWRIIFRRPPSGFDSV